MKNISDIRKKFNESPTIDNVKSLIKHYDVTWNDLLLCLKSKDSAISTCSRDKLKKVLKQRKVPDSKLLDIDHCDDLIEKLGMPLDFRVSNKFDHMKATTLNGKWMVLADLGFKFNKQLLHDFFEVMVVFGVLALICFYRGLENTKIIISIAILMPVFIFVMVLLLNLLLVGRTKKIHAYEYILSEEFLEITNSGIIDIRIDWESIQTIEWKNGCRITHTGEQVYLNNYMTKDVFKFILEYHQGRGN